MSSPTTSAPVTLEFTMTDAAAAQVRTIMAQQSLEADERNLRIFVEGGGCCGGVQFGLAFDKAQPDDVKLERAGLSVVIDPTSAPMVHGATIDFVNTPEIQGFKVTGAPMKSSSCGGGSCGSGGCGPAEGEGHDHGAKKSGEGCGSGGCGCG